MLEPVTAPRHRSGTTIVVALCGLLGALLIVLGLIVIDPFRPAPPQPLAVSVRLEPVSGGFDKPVQLVADGAGRDYVVEKVGRVTRLAPDGSPGEVLLDISDRVLDHHERGLLALAFHPDHAENGRFFVTYSQQRDGATAISEFTIPVEPPPGEEAPVPIERTERPILVIAQPFNTHKGGMLAFDVDGMLLVSTGDGGSAWDPQSHGLDPGSLLGKLLRIDVDRGWPYAIPPGNGFAGVEGARPEVHAIGLRNPWRYSLDRESGAIVIADVGQREWEEVNLLEADTRTASFGWSEMDGATCRRADGCADGHRDPVIAYPHVDGETGHCAVVGGDIYRGIAGTLPDRTYLYGDHCSGTLWAVPLEQLLQGAAAPAVVGSLDPAAGRIQGFGTDSAGEPHVLTSEGGLYRVIAA